MDQVYAVWHEYELKDDFGAHDEIKFIGVYSTEEKANEAIQRLQNQPGFCDHPIECFFVEPYTINETMGMEGFITERYNV